MALIACTAIACLRLDHEDHRVVAEPIAQRRSTSIFATRTTCCSTLATEQIGALRAALREARLGMLAGRGALAVRETFRLSLVDRRHHASSLHEPGEVREPVWIVHGDEIPRPLGAEHTAPAEYAATQQHAVRGPTPSTVEKSPVSGIDEPLGAEGRRA